MLKRKQVMKKKLFQMTALLLGGAIIALSSCKKDDDDDDQQDSGSSATEYNEADGVVTVKDHGEGTGTMTWTAGKTYILDGKVFVNNGQTLTIEAGTLIKGKSGSGTSASALVVARGGKIMAEGTAEKPIVFTAETDDYEGTIVSTTERGLWGGVIILGKGKLNSSPGTSQVEGIETSESRANYGGTDNTDNSGTLKYVSIRHGGSDIGEGNEINGLTLGGVGSGTTIQYIEVIANKDDGVEFFGGVPQLKNILVAYVGDDSYDYDEGFDGKGQFWVAIQESGAGDRLGEHDGGTDPETAEPYATPDIYNATYIGRGSTASKRVITFRDNAGGFYINSIFANQAKGIDVEVLASSQDSYKQLQEGNLKIQNCIFSDVKADSANFDISYVGDSVDASGEAVMDPSDEEKQLPTASLTAKANAAKTYIQGQFSTWNNTTATALVSASNPVPASGASSGAAPTDSWFDNVTYQGAFEPGGTNWASGWSLAFPSK
jgi:hypothetical protein